MHKKKSLCVPEIPARRKKFKKVRNTLSERPCFSGWWERYQLTFQVIYDNFSSLESQANKGAEAQEDKTIFSGLHNFIMWRSSD